MSYDLCFKLANYFVMPAWALLIFAPRHHLTKGLIDSLLVPFTLALLYATLILPRISPSVFEAFSTLQGVGSLFQDPAVLLAGWVHYLAFDFFVGTWILNDAQQRKLSHGLVAPILFATFMMGPVGFGAYFLCRRIGRRS